MVRSRHMEEVARKPRDSMGWIWLIKLMNPYVVPPDSNGSMALGVALHPHVKRCAHLIWVMLLM